MKTPPIAVLAVLWASTATGQIVVSANDAKVTLVDGVTATVRNPPPDTVTIIDLGVSPPRIVAELPAPTSVVGPPQSVAIAPDDSIALVTAAQKLDPADPTKTVPDDRVSVIDLKASPPVVAATLHAGSGASGVSINPAGTLALVANRMEGTISVFTIKGRTVTASGKVDLGAPESGPSHVAFTRDGRRALVTRNNDSFISVLAVDGTSVTYTKRDIAGGLKPYGIEISPAADVAVAGNIGAGATGGADTLSVIDLAADPPRTVDQTATGPTAEGVGMSNDGRYVSVTVMNGSNLAKSSPLYHAAGRLQVFRLDKTTLTSIASAPVGQWCQGTVWARDGRTVLVQCMVQREILVFRFDGRQLTPAGTLKVSGGPAGIRAGR
jgi:DNA-binding beta-propeller fold protein YncE